MIEIKNLCKSYPNITVYDNFNLSLEEGEITCFLGESGSGKTTLLNAVASLTDYSGKISAVKCSYIFQSPTLVPCLNVFDNLKLVCSDERKISNMLDILGLTDKAESYPVKLSGGQAQRVAIARAFLYESEAILMDEPFSSLDIKLKLSIIDNFLKLRKTDKRTVIFVTHDIDEAAAIADRIIILNAGRIVFDKYYSDASERSGREKESIRAELLSSLLAK